MADLSSALAYGRRAPYDYFAKEEWLRQGLLVLRQLAKDLGLPKGTYEVRTMPAGPAVAGDVVLHHDRLYVNLSPFNPDDAGYARSCRDRKDYSGGRNRFLSTDYAEVYEVCRSILLEAGIEAPPLAPAEPVGRPKATKVYGWAVYLIRDIDQVGRGCFRCVVAASSKADVARIVGCAPSQLWQLGVTSDAEEVQVALTEPGVVWYKVEGTNMAFQRVDDPVGRF